MALLMDSSWSSWRIWRIGHLVTETRDRVEGCPKGWDRSWGILVRGSHLDFWSAKWNGMQMELLRSDSRLGSLIILSGAVHTGVEVCRMYSEMSGLVERPWLQLMCCAICLLRGCNFRWRRGSPSGSECWMVCCHWTPEIKFNKRLSSLIIRLANYSITTSLIYKLIR